MPEDTIAVADSGSTAQPIAPLAAPAASAPAPIGITSDQLKARLDETRDKTRSDVLKELGFPSLTEGKKALEALKKLQDAQLSEQERTAKELSELRSASSRYEQHSKLFASMVEGEIAKLPEAARAAIDEQSADNPDERYRLLNFMRKVGIPMSAAADGSANQAQPSAAAQPVAATPSLPAPAPKPVNAGAVPIPPRGVTPRSKYEEWQEKAKFNQVAGDLFFQLNAAEIERTRPVDQ